jgi:hypothetical protein
MKQAYLTELKANPLSEAAANARQQFANSFVPNILLLDLIKTNRSVVVGLDDVSRPIPHRNREISSTSVVSSNFYEFSKKLSLLKTQHSGAIVRFTIIGSSISISILN